MFIFSLILEAYNNIIIHMARMLNDYEIYFTMHTIIFMCMKINDVCENNMAVQKETNIDLIIMYIHKMCI